LTDQRDHTFSVCAIGCEDQLWHAPEPATVGNESYPRKLVTA
jgi:hypothetical protein